MKNKVEIRDHELKNQVNNNRRAVAHAEHNTYQLDELKNQVKNNRRAAANAVHKTYQLDEFDSGTSSM